MSKHRHKNKNKYSRVNNMNENGQNNYAPINSNPFGINPQQLLSLLGSGFTMNGLGNILSTMNMEGFDLNSISNNIGMNNYNSNINKNNTRNINNSFQRNNEEIKIDNESKNINEQVDKNINEDKYEEVREEDENLEDYTQFDEDIELIISLKSIVDPRRIPFLDKIIDKYYKGEFK